MAKEAYYFSHDENARNDRKIKALRKRYGMKGYGQFWVIIEMLRSEEDNKMPLDEITFIALSDEFVTDESEAKKFVNDLIDTFELLDSDGDFFWSNSLNRRMDKKEEISQKRRDAVNKRWNNCSKKDTENQSVNTNAIQNYTNEIQTDTIKGKESKGKEIKGNKKKEKEINSFQKSFFSIPDDALFLRNNYGLREKEEIEHLVNFFFEEKKTEGKTDWKSQTDFNRHFKNWLKFQSVEKILRNTKTRKNGKYGVYTKEKYETLLADQATVKIQGKNGNLVLKLNPDGKAIFEKPKIEEQDNSPVNLRISEMIKKSVAQ